MAEDKGLVLPAALLKALWSVEGSYSRSLVVQYQCQVADGLAPDEEDLTEADWWFMEAPEDLSLW